MAPADDRPHDLASLIRVRAGSHGKQVAFCFAERSLSYDEFDRVTDRVASRLRHAGIGPGDRVAALLFNTPEFLLLWGGLAKLRAILVPLNTALKGEILRYELEDSRPAGLVIDRRLWPVYAELRSSVTIPRVWWVDRPSETDPPPDGPRPWTDLEEVPGEIESGPAPDPWDPVAILYTSGTTGPPKGALIPHEKILTTSWEIGQRSRLAPGSVLFTALPLFHCNAQEMTTLTSMLYGMTAAYDERFHASTYWPTAARWGATHISLLISMINVLYKQPDRPTDRQHTVRTALTAGTTKAVWNEFERRFGLTIIELYGMTECGCTTLMNPPDAIRVGSIGTPLGFVEAQVVDDHDRPLPPDTRGELVVRPRAPYTMFMGYINKPEQTVESWRNLWFHTGDYVVRDSEGYFYFVDRKKDVIRRRGENLAPYDVETVINRHPSVFESVVVGVPSPLGEEDVKAFVQLKPGVAENPREIFEFCARELPFFMVPQYIEFIDAIPKTANQKAQRFQLRGRTGGRQYDRNDFGIQLQKP
jgi:crotonobetaine/carnitine-CoA ligase